MSGIVYIDSKKSYNAFISAYSIFNPSFLINPIDYLLDILYILMLCISIYNIYNIYTILCVNVSIIYLRIKQLYIYLQSYIP